VGHIQIIPDIQTQKWKDKIISLFRLIKLSQAIVISINRYGSQGELPIQE